MKNESTLTLAGDFYTNDNGHKFCKYCYESQNQEVKLKPIYVVIRDEGTHEITNEWTEYTCPICHTRIKP